MISSTAIVTRELNRIEQATGVRPIEWLEEIADDAWQIWIEGNDCDVESYEQMIENNADQYIDFMKENYPKEC